MEQFVELLKEINVVQIFIIFAGGWLCYNRLDKKIETTGNKFVSLESKFDNKFAGLEIKFDNKFASLESKFDNKFVVLESKFDNKFTILESKFDNKFENIENKFDKLSEKVEDVDRRLCRIEGSLASHGHCLFNQAKLEQKAE